MLVGRYAADGCAGLSLYAFDQHNASFGFLDSIDLAAPSYLVADQASDMLYVVDELKDSSASLSAVHVDSARHQLKIVNAVRTEGASPCHVAKYGDMVATANYRGGSVSLFRISQSGCILSLQTVIKGIIGGPDPTRQGTPHVHSVLFSPDGRYLFATDFSADRIMGVQVTKPLLHDATIIGHDIARTIPVTPDAIGGYGPRHMVFSSDKRYLYVIGELSDCVTVYEYHEGSLSEVQTIVADDDHGRGGGDILFSPDGKFLYTSHRRKNDKIVIFSVDRHSGLLTKIGTHPTKSHPRQFSLTPNGRFLLVACMDEHVIQIFRRNPATGLLSDTNQSVSIETPAFVGFL